MAKKSSPVATESSVDFEASMAELERIVSALERGDLSLEASLLQFEHGVALTRQCRDALVRAEQKVSILLKEHGTATLSPFDTPDDQ